MKLNKTHPDVGSNFWMKVRQNYSIKIEVILIKEM